MTEHGPRRTYEDELTTLYLGDARTETNWLNADVLITDPPYGRKWQQRDLANDTHHGIIGDENTSTRDTILDLWGADRPAIVFGDLTLPPPKGCKQVLIYAKPPDAGARGAVGGWRRDAEAIYLIGQWPTGIGGETSILRTQATSIGGPYGNAGRYGHPHAKPGDIMAKLVAHTDGVIADPFAGSGTTLVVAKRLGRRSIGVEIDERYFKTATRRLSQGVLWCDEYEIIEGDK